jgi:hypothetical protein
MQSNSQTRFNPAIVLLQNLRLLLRDPAFLERHRGGSKAFTRKRALTFPIVMLFVLQKTVKSLQLHLHEFLDQWNEKGLEDAVSGSAFTRARAKLRHQAYVEFNEKVLLPTVYCAENADSLRLWRGHRMLGVDSSLIRLPLTTELSTVFGLVECGNQKVKAAVAYPQARISVLYDVLNDIGWDARLTPHKTAETELARQHMAHVLKGDLLLCDRGYAGYFWFALLMSMGVEFVVRCSLGSFGAVQELFRRNEAGVSVEVTLNASSDIRKDLRPAGLPLTLRVRFVTVQLSTGELEVLATSLLDAQRYPTEEFAMVYHWRWGIETYYGRIKGRLDLENWSGKTEEAIRQDFHAAVFLSNLESVLCQTAQQELTQKTAHRRQPAQINRSVSLHAIKSKIIELLAGSLPVEKVIRHLQRLFKANPVSVRSDRKVPRKKTQSGQAYHYQRNVKKVVF